MFSLFQQLKQRRIAQIVASYAVSGWVAMEVVGALVERGVMPEMAYRLGLVLYLGGLGASMVLGWYHGEKGEQQFTRFETGLLVLIAAATVLGGYRTFLAASRAAAAEQLAIANAANLNRVAVLYFADLSRERDLGYLADGLTESLIDRLEDLQALDVISRTGSAQFRDSELPRDSVARLLGAGILVEGAVETRGSDVRVSISLRDGTGGAELYRSSFDAPASDVFTMQDELAEDVADKLRSWLGPEISLRSARRGTDNVAAWADYQRGLRARREAEARISDGDIPGFIEGFQRAEEWITAAAEADANWMQPRIVHALLASRWGELSAFEDRAEANEYFDLALERIDAVLWIEPRNAAAHQARGTIQYLRWSFGVIADAGAATKALDEAQKELERATELDATLAQAWFILSVVYSQKTDIVKANQAALNALQADEFLRAAESIMTTLYTTSYDLELLVAAQDYCQRGHARFPENPELTACALWLMAAGRIPADVDRAWRIADEYLELVSPANREREAVSIRLVVAQVIAEASRSNASLADSARSVVAGAQATPALDPTRELLGFEALVYLKLDDPATAIDRLGVYLAASPSHREGWRWTAHWWWRPLQNDPEFRRLLGR